MVIRIRLIKYAKAGRTTDRPCLVAMVLLYKPPHGTGHRDRDIIPRAHQSTKNGAFKLEG